MLETKDLVKIYKPKKGVPVVALDKVSLSFPDKGMVFLLGKSGSGKSTLLNLLGGLDNYNSGEIIIKGVSSKSFKQRHFDSYRNTYVGFIFQEYNVLEEFTVGANIALAIELQNRKATNEEINEILKEVDLEGYGARKPNELSGGQKQRVAIARALVKKPEIIMADEPTGALDSATGKQVFETLKKLSKSRLVIVVSHDRDFAERYADRIIELADGRVISDLERDNSEVLEEEKIVFSGSTATVPAGYHLTEEDVALINEYIDKLKNGELEISFEGTKKSKRFKETDNSKIIKRDGSDFKLIKSKLPLRNAFKIGATGLKYKKFRLVMTIFLSCIAFSLFGLADTFGSYNLIKTCTNSLLDSNYNYISVAKSKRYGEEGDHWNSYGYRISKKDIEDIEKETGIELNGTYCPDFADLSFESQVNPEIELSETGYSVYETYFTGFTEINPKIIEGMGFKILAGKLPEKNNEIAVSEYVLEVFKKAQYFDGATLKDKKPAYEKIQKADELVGKVLTLDGSKYTVTAVIDTGFDIERYKSLTVKKEAPTRAEELLEMVLYTEFESYFSYSYAGMLMTNSECIEKVISSRPAMSRITEGYIWFQSEDYKVQADSQYLATLSDIKDEKVVWLDGEKKSLKNGEIIVTTDCLYIDSENEDIIEELKKNNNLTSAQSILGREYEYVKGYKIVGIIDNTDYETTSKLESTIVCDDKLFATFAESKDHIFEMAIGAMPKEKAELQNMVAFCYNEEGNVRYPIQTAATFELDALNEILKKVSVWFFWIGVGFAAFASLMLSNFIAISISYKKQEIGILRAIGSRSNDVFRIFFAESFIIAMINFVLSSAGVCAATILINYFIRENVGILVTVLSFDLRQILLLFAVSVAVAFFASFFPVKRIASKKPIDAIRNR